MNNAVRVIEMFGEVTQTAKDVIEFGDDFVPWLRDAIKDYEEALELWRKSHNSISSDDKGGM